MGDVNELFAKAYSTRLNTFIIYPDKQMQERMSYFDYVHQLEKRWASFSPSFDL